MENEILRVLVLALLTAAAISGLPEKRRARASSACSRWSSQIVFRVIRMIMWAAPLGAFGGMAYTVAKFGGDIAGNLVLLMVTFWLTCATFIFVILGAVSRWAGFSIFKLIRLIKDELLIIVGTSSSETVLPRLLAKLESAGASRQVVGVVLPTGYSFNLDGTCIYLTLGALFIVQAPGRTCADRQQIALAGLMILTSKGAAGITGAGLVTLTASLQAFGGEFFSPESIAVGIALVVGIDRIMSEGRALTNAIGNAAATSSSRRGRASWTRSASRPCSTIRRSWRSKPSEGCARRGVGARAAGGGSGARLAGQVTSRRRPVSTS